MPTAKKSSSKNGSRTSTKRRTVADVMTPDPVALIETETLTAAARVMEEHDIGDVLVLDDTSARVKGIVTDRDMVVRALAEGMDPQATTLSAICSEDVVMVGPDDPIDDAVTCMRERAVRRIPVVEDGRPVGVVTMGDLAQVLDKKSALAEVSAAPANS